MADAETPVAKDDPLSIAWEAYRATANYKSAKHWALVIAPLIQAGHPDAERLRYGLMPIDQRENHVEGSLWAAFLAGYEAASLTQAPPKDQYR